MTKQGLLALLEKIQKEYKDDGKNELAGCVNYIFWHVMDLESQPQQVTGAWIKCFDRMPVDESKPVNWRCIDMSDGDYTVPSQMKRKYKKSELEWWDEDAQPQPVYFDTFREEFEYWKNKNGYKENAYGNWRKNNSGPWLPIGKVFQIFIDVYKPQPGKDAPHPAQGDGYAIDLLAWAMNMTDPHKGNTIYTHKMDLVDGVFYWEQDNEGDQPLEASDMHKLYLQDTDWPRASLPSQSGESAGVWVKASERKPKHGDFCRYIQDGKYVRGLVTMVETDSQGSWIMTSWHGLFREGFQHLLEWLDESGSLPDFSEEDLREAIELARVGYKKVDPLLQNTEEEIINQIKAKL